MKKLFAIVAMLGLFAFGTTQSILAQDGAQAAAAGETTEQVDSLASDSTATDSTAVAAEETATAPVEEAEPESFHKTLKTKFTHLLIRFGHVGCMIGSCDEA